jgi:MYXO-CTERM domain-containing protein
VGTGGAAGGEPGQATSGGCSCAIDAPPRAAWTALIAGLVGAFIARRRRRF